MEVRAYTIGTPRPLERRDAKIQVGSLEVFVVPHFRFEVADDDQDFSVSMWLEFDEDRMQYQAGQLTVTRRDGVAGVTGTMLRRVRVLDYLRMGARHGIFAKLPGSATPVSVAETFGSGALFAVEGIEESLRLLGPRGAAPMVALSYVTAHVSSWPPAKAVQIDLGLPARTATHWIAIARELGEINGLPDPTSEAR